MGHLIMIVVGLLLSSMIIGTTMNYTSNSIALKEKKIYISAYNHLEELNEIYYEKEGKVLSVSNWESELTRYGSLPYLPSKNVLSYGYDTSSKDYYFCITRNEPEKHSHQAMSSLRSGYPRSFDESTSTYSITESSGFDSSFFNVNEVCGSKVDYDNEPLETNNFSTPLASTFWIGNITRYYKKNAKEIEEDFVKLKNAFDKYVLANGSAPVVDSIENVFVSLRSYGELPIKHKDFQWSYGLNGSSNYFCLSTISTSSMTPNEREIHAESLYELNNVFDESYFKVNRTSCISSSQAKTTDYSNEINVYASYLLN